MLLTLGPLKRVWKRSESTSCPKGCTVESPLEGTFSACRAHFCFGSHVKYETVFYQNVIVSERNRVIPA